MHRRFRHILQAGMLISCLLVVSACSYQLRQAERITLPFDQVSLDCDFKKHWHLCQRLSNKLSLRGVSVSEEAPYTLHIRTREPSQRILTIAGDASTEEYELRLHLKYRLQVKRSQQTLAKNALHLSRLYRHQTTALLAKQRERDNMTRSMYEQLSNIMLSELAELTMPTSPSTQAAP